LYCVRTSRAIATACALLALGSACSSAKPFVAPPTSTTVFSGPVTTHSEPTTSTTGASASSTTSTPATGTTTTTAAPTQPTVPATSLAALILDNAPSAYPRQPDDVGQTGPTNISQAALDDVSPNARRALLVTGFVNGYQRQWTSPDGYTIDQIFLYQFSTPKGALGYAQHWHDTLLKTNQKGIVLLAFTPAFLPAGALGLQSKDETGSTAVVMFAKGTYAVEATVNSGAAVVGSPPVDQSGAATALAAAQYQRLP
jgi:hypothetical protein